VAGRTGRPRLTAPNLACRPPWAALCCLCAEKFERMKAVVKRYVDKDMKALDSFPDGSQ
jgi:hypothetical protein